MNGPLENYPRLTVTPEQILDGQLCDCQACLKDGRHEPKCGVHKEPVKACRCSREEQSEAAG